MDKYKWQTLVAGIAIFVGAILGNTLSNHYGEEQRKQDYIQKQKEINEVITKANEVIGAQNEYIGLLHTAIKAKQDSILQLQTLQERIEKDVEHKRREAVKMTSDEKVDWLIDRYDSIVSP